ncbi:MAG: 2-amino-4-hydroxy-6-hydroxymethyldihydropteridine diphosphokinase [Chloroflexi bacterium]|nr:2-amino-4-hydroxy-6-hydroxymethyldihydropteridine diphosphokinase [Chloroflexota bacterium]
MYLGLGSNLGDRRANLQTALRLLERVGLVRRVSSLYETVPVGPEQPMFYNAACECETDLPPRELLRCVQEVEQEMGRPRDDERWGPRLIDIDILLYGDEVIDEDGLAIPHAEMRNRSFVLVPLAEIAPEVRHPAGEAVASLARATGVQGVEKVAGLGWEQAEEG